MKRATQNSSHPSTPKNRAPKSTPASRARHTIQHLAPRFLTGGAMAAIATVLVTTSVPAAAFTGQVVAPPVAPATITQPAPQTLTLGTETPITVAGRDSYGVTRAIREISIAGLSYQYLDVPVGGINWPFPGGSPIASGFGSRHVENCDFCSTFHEGLDFTPGEGTGVHAIADGTVVEATGGGPLGNHVVIQHTIDGQNVQSVYGHMLDGSLAVAAGQQVVAGEPIGAVGSTGNSTGPHLHLEIHVNGTPIDPMGWLSAHAH